MSTSTDTDWRSRAACAGMPTDLFFPNRGESGATAKRTCARCTVQDECAADAAQGNTCGIWAGLVWLNGHPRMPPTGANNTYSSDERRKATELYRAIRPEHTSDRAACRAVSQALGIAHPKTIGVWVGVELPRTDRRVGQRDQQRAERRRAAIAMFNKIRPKHPSDASAMRQVARHHGAHPETVRGWVNDSRAIEAAATAGATSAPTTQDQE